MIKLADAINEPELVHRLLVLTFDAEAELTDLLEVIHDPHCPYFPGDDTWPAQYQCGVHNEISNTGLDSFFVHKEDVENAGWGRVEQLEPGLYEIEHWVEQTGRDGPWGPAEWESGLRVVDHPREPHPDLSITAEVSRSYCVWVWMGGADIPHWELRGTGLVL